MPPGPPSISTVIPLFNRERMILECLDSVAAQTLLPDQVLIVDDGSTDDGAAAVQAWIDARNGDARFRLLALPACGGAAAARNRGLSELGPTTWVAFLDSDDLWPPDFLERTAAILGSDPTVVAVTADISVERPNRQPTLRSLASMETDVADALFRDAGIGSATVLRTDAVQTAGAFDESISTAHDVLLFCAVSAHGQWRHAPGAPVRKREGLHGAGEDGRLSQRFLDREKRWAEAYQSAIEQHGERMGLGRRQRARLIGRRWYRAGDAARRNGDTRAARACLRHAIRWRPFKLQARLKLLATYLP